MATPDLNTLTEAAIRIGGLDAQSALRIVNAVYRDGVVDRAEADALFDLNDKLAEWDPAWDQRFIEAVKDFVLTVEAPLGWVSEAECDWLIERVTRDGVIRHTSELDLLLQILRHAEGAPERLGAFTLDAVCGRIRAAGLVTFDDVERVRRALYAPAGEGAVWVTRREATALFALNDDIGFARNHAAWNDLFARAIGNHLIALALPSPTDEAAALARQTWLVSEGGVGAFLTRMAGSIGQGSWFDKIAYDSRRAAEARIAAQTAAAAEASKIDPGETDWFRKRLGWDKKISPAEQALIDFLKSEVPGLAHGLAIAA